MGAVFQSRWLSPGHKLHLQHGPIDLVIVIDDSESKRQAGFAAATKAFDGLLESLVSHLGLLRSEVVVDPFGEQSTIHAADAKLCTTARQMIEACVPFARFRVTPMAAVAGAVADHVLGSIVATVHPRRAWVNNGGDIALSLAPGQEFHCALVTNTNKQMEKQIQGCISTTTDQSSALSRCVITASDGIKGIATSGRQGRSMTLGIADAVTVLASSASIADVAATVLANQVDLPGHPAIHRTPANTLDPDSDLGDRTVVTSVGDLSDEEIRRALAPAATCAKELVKAGLASAVSITLDSETLVVPPYSVNESHMKNLSAKNWEEVA